LWYLFQHNATRIALVMSYTWKAAQLVGSPGNPGYTSCTTLGLNPFKNSTKVGATDACKALVTVDTRLLINDEVSLTPQHHLHVSLGRCDSANVRTSCNGSHTHVT
jgi:hypothetical protein